VDESPKLDHGEVGATGRYITLQCKATDEAFNSQVRAVPCCTLPCRTVLCCAVLCCAVLYCGGGMRCSLSLPY
jgi:hypothetical protein